MDINSFIAQLPGGGARPNLFRIIMPFPSFATIGGETAKMAFLARAAMIPESVLNTIEVPFRGRRAKIPGARLFPNQWEVTVLNDNDFMLRNAFERWSNGINSNDTNVGRTRIGDISVDIQVEQLDQNENVIKTYTIKGAWPAVVSGIQLNQDQIDVIEEFTVAFAFQTWASDTTS